MQDKPFNQYHKPMGDAASELVKQFDGLEGVIVVGVTNNVSPDGSKRHCVVAAAIKASEVDDYKHSLIHAIRALNDALSHLPDETSVELSE